MLILASMISDIPCLEHSNSYIADVFLMLQATFQTLRYMAVLPSTCRGMGILPFLISALLS